MAAFGISKVKKIGISDECCRLLQNVDNWNWGEGKTDCVSVRLMGLGQTSVLAFVIDTTGSMYDDIDEAKRVSFSIIDSRRGTSEEPSEYVLVPFNDPGKPIVVSKISSLF